tara:strand:- start:2475 stop:3203 length:729 start_codon:yes stop_codon:yes gene_type:complete
MNNNLSDNLDFFKKNILENKNFNFVKIGDGEMLSMRFQKGRNIDLHPYSKSLGENTRKSFLFLMENKNSYIGDWFFSNPPINQMGRDNLKFFNSFIKDKKINFIRPFEVLMLGWGSEKTSDVLEFYRVIKNTKRNKIYVGPQRISKIKDVLSIDFFIEVPLINAYSKIEEIYNKIIPCLTKDSIIMYSVGLMSPVLINKVIAAETGTTNLDIGSGFDCLFYKQTRGNKQATKQFAESYFKKI